MVHLKPSRLTGECHEVRSGGQDEKMNRVRRVYGVASVAYSSDLSEQLLILALNNPRAPSTSSGVWTLLAPTRPTFSEGTTGAQTGNNGILQSFNPSEGLPSIHREKKTPKARHPRETSSRSTAAMGVHPVIRHVSTVETYCKFIYI